MVLPRRLRDAEEDLNKLTGAVVDAAFKVHTTLGPGLLEQVYKVCLSIELQRKGLEVQSEVLMPVIYHNHVIDVGYRLDLLVESEVIVELKSVEQLHSIHKAQLLTYLKLAKKKLGLLINFNSPVIKDGIVRLIN